MNPPNFLLPIRGSKTKPLVPINRITAKVRTSSHVSGFEGYTSTDQAEIGKVPCIMLKRAEKSYNDVTKTADNKGFRTQRGFLNGQEPDEGIYFAYRATLRIFGEIPDIHEISRRLGIAPTSSHRRGEKKGPNSPPYKHDMWSYTSPVKESEPLHVHIDSLWNTFREHKEYLLELKKGLTVDVFLGYRSNCDHAGVEVPHESLEMFRELQIPFGLSIIVA